jgi:acyl-CoA thioesterase I
MYDDKKLPLFFQPRNGLSRTVHRLQRQLPLRVGFLGGSVTDGANASDREMTSWRALTAAYLTYTYPGVVFSFVNGAIGGTTSTFGAFRVAEQLFGEDELDLIFVDFAVNDTDGEVESVRAMEGIVRRVGRLNPAAELCFIYMADETTVQNYLTEKALPSINIAAHERVADYYGLPTLNISQSIAALLGAEAVRWQELSDDAVHPNDYGFALYARLTQKFLARILNIPPSVYPSAYLTRPPLDTACYENGESLSWLNIKGLSGWQSVKNWSPVATTCNWQPPVNIRLASAPAKIFSFDFQGSHLGLSLLAGPDTGILEYCVDNQKTFQKLELYDKYCALYYRPKFVLLASNLAFGRHTVHLRPAASTPTRSNLHLLDLWFS